TTDGASPQTPGYFTLTSPSRILRFASPIATPPSPSTTATTCSVCARHGLARQSSTSSPPIACSATPGNIVCSSRPFQVPNGDSLICALARRRRDRADRLLVVDNRLPSRRGSGLLLQRRQHLVRRRRRLGHPDTDRIAGPEPSSARKASSTARGSRACRFAAMVSGS